MNKVRAGRKPWSPLLSVGVLVVATVLVCGGCPPRTPETYVLSLFKGSATPPEAADRIIQALPEMSWPEYEKASGGQTMALLSWLHGLPPRGPIHADCLLRSVSGLDGAYSELYSIILANLYRDDPIIFAGAAARLPSEQATLAFRYLAYGLSYVTSDVREDLLFQAESLLQSDELSEAERRALRDIIAAIQEQ